MSLNVPAVLVHLLIIKKRSLAATALRAPPYFETILCKFCSTFLRLNISDCPVVKDLRYWIWMKRPIF